MERMSELEYLSLQDNLFRNNKQRFSCATGHRSPQWHSAASAPGHSERSSVSSYTLSGETTEAVLLMACMPSAQCYMIHSFRKMASLFLSACTLSALV